MTSRLRQVVLTCARLDPAREQFRDLFGSGPGDVDPAMADYDLEHEVLKVGRDTYLEICAPLHSEADTTATRFLRRGGDGGYMAVVQVPSADVLRKRLTGLGLSIPLAENHHGNELTQLHPREFGTLLEADEIVGDADWHYPALEGTTNTDLTLGIVAVDVAVDDPATIAARWSQAFDQPLGPDGTSSVLFDGGGVVRFVEATGARGGVVALDVTAADRHRVGEVHAIGGVTVSFT